MIAALPGTAQKYVKHSSAGALLGRVSAGILPTVLDEGLGFALEGPGASG